MSNVRPVLPFPEDEPHDDRFDGTREVDGDVELDRDVDDSRIESAEADRIASGAESDDD